MHPIFRAAAVILAGLAAEPARPAEAPEVKAAVIEAEQVPPDGRFRFLPSWRAPALPRTAFALSGGAAWGLAHIGMLQAAEEDGLSADMIAGTSFGALVGALIGSGLSPSDIETLFRERDWNQALSRQDRPATETSAYDPLDPENAVLTAGRGRGGRGRLWQGAVPDWMILAELFRLLGRAGAVAEGNLDRLAVPFRAVSVDLVKGEVFAPAQGPLPMLVRASIGLPVLRPVPLQGKLLVDGGVLENVPVPTARGMGAEVVIASALNRQGKDLLEPIPEITSLAGLLERTYDVAFSAQRHGQLAGADATLLTAVGAASLADFHDELDTLVLAGRASWERGRTEVFQVLQSRARDPRVFTLRTVEAGPATPPQAVRELQARLLPKGSPAEWSALRLQMELARLLNRGEHPGGRLELPGDGRAILHLVPPETVGTLDIQIPSALAPEFATFPEGRGRTPGGVLGEVAKRLHRARQRGLLFAGITRADWEPSSARLRIDLEAGTLGGLELRTTAAGRTVTVKRPLPDQSGQPAELDRLRETAVRLYQRGEVAGISGVDARRDAAGGYLVRVNLLDPLVWEMTVNGGFSDALGLVALARMSWPSFASWTRWGLEVRAAAAREGGVLGIEASPPGAVSRQFFLRLQGGRLLVPRFTPDADQIGAQGFWSAAASLGVRTNPGKWGFFEGALIGRDTGRGGLSIREDDPGTDLAAGLAWRGDRRDDPFWPTRGMAWSVETALPVWGKQRPWQVSGAFGVHFPLDAAARWTIEISLAASLSQTGRPLPFDRWFDPGGWWEAPRLLPSRGLTPSGHRSTLVLRRDLGRLGGISVVSGLSGSLWSLDQIRFDPAVPRRGHGVAGFLEARTGRLGPLTLGVTSGKLRGGTVFLLFGVSRFPRPGPFPRLPGN